MNIQIATRHLLQDALLFLSKINSSLYTQTIPSLFNSTLGKHTRHFIEVYQCLLFREHPFIVNYDARKRDIVLETDLESAKHTIQCLIDELPQIPLQQNIFLVSLLAPHKKISTNIIRELLYNYDHCVHHLAMMRVGLRIIQPEIVLPEHIGLAPSTLKQEQLKLKSKCNGCNHT